LQSVEEATRTDPRDRHLLRGIWPAFVPWLCWGAAYLVALLAPMMINLAAEFLALVGIAWACVSGVRWIKLATDPESELGLLRFSGLTLVMLTPVAFALLMVLGALR
jgi:hypothetical protein